MQRTQRAKIVLIDDHPEHLEYLATLLRRVGYEVATFTAGVPALYSSDLRDASLVIADVVMPEMDGFEVLMLLQKVHPGLPFVAVSGAGGSLNAAMLTYIEQLGARACFSKPLEEDGFLRRIATLVSERGRSKV